MEIINGVDQDDVAGDVTDIDGATIDDSIIGGTTPAAGSFTTLEASTDPVDADGVGDREFNDARYCLETNNLSDVGNAATSFGNIKQAATESATGVLEKATTVEVVTGTDTNRAVTPAGVTARMAAPGTIGGATPAAGSFTTVSIDTNVITCHNATGSEIAARSVCYVSGDQSGVPQITKAQADAEANAKGLLVVPISAIANGAAGACCEKGKVSGFSGLTPKEIQYLSDDTAGAIEETATTTSTEIVRIVGIALSATVLWFNPDITYVEVA